MANLQPGGATLAVGRAEGTARTARAYRAARRHSGLVRALRVALILGVVGAIVFLVGKALWRTFGAKVEGLELGGLSVDGTSIVMARPKLTGGRNDGGGYVITAEKAVQDLRRPTQVELVDVSGDITGGDKAVSHLTASAGHYDTSKETLALSGAIRLSNASYTVELRSANIDFKSGVYVSSDPVSVMTSSGASVTADSAEMRDSGRQIAFEGRVHTVIKPANPPLAGADSKELPP